MPGFFSEELLEDIRNANSIHDVVSEYLPLKKSGRNFMGLCPFHAEKTASFTVNTEKQIYHCFGCGEGGNIFGFIMKQQNMTFPEAVRHLAQRGGVVIPENIPPAQRERSRERERLQDANTTAAEYFRKNLHASAGRKVQGYLSERGLSSETIEAFGLGYALPAWDDLAKALRSGGYKEGELQKAGLIVPRASGGFIDRFRARVIFPIGDAQGRTVGFGGRILGEGEPKYLNSPETPLYNKSRVLYGFDKARDDIRKEGFGIVVEGYFDCIALHQAGFRNTVATSGTALTEGHLKLMQRFSERWTVVFDGDAAGIRAARRSLELFITQGLFARCVLLPTDEDPDTFIRKKGTDAFRTLLDGAESLMEFFISQSAQQHSTGTVEGKVAAVREVVPLLAKVKERVARAEYVGFAAHRLGVKEEVLWSEVQAASSRGKPGASAVRGGARAAGPVKAEEAGIVRAILSSESVAARMKEEVSLEDLEDEDCRAVAGKIFSLIDDGRGKEIARGLRFDEERLNRFVAPWLVDDERFSDEETALREARDCLTKIRRRRIDHQSRQLQEKIVQAEKSGDKDMLHKLLRIKHELRVQTGREHREARR